MLYQLRGDLKRKHENILEIKIFCLTQHREHVHALAGGGRRGGQFSSAIVVLPLARPHGPRPWAGWGRGTRIARG